MEGITNSKKSSTGNQQHQLLVSEAASALTHLATGGGGGAACTGTTNTESAISTRTRVDGQVEKASTTAKSDTTAPPPHQGQSLHDQNESLNGKPPSSKAEIIKETVISRLNRPEDIVKRNMFAVEGKSIKFPVKVSLFCHRCVLVCKYPSFKKSCLCMHSGAFTRMNAFWASLHSALRTFNIVSDTSGLNSSSDLFLNS